MLLCLLARSGPDHGSQWLMAALVSFWAPGLVVAGLVQSLCLIIEAASS